MINIKNPPSVKDCRPNVMQRRPGGYKPSKGVVKQKTNKPRGR